MLNGHIPTVTISRRSTLAGLMGTAALALLPGRLLAHGGEVNAAFRHGVASGDPDHGSVVLWTRIEPGSGTDTVEWELAREPEFTRIVKSGKVLANADRDHTVKLLADGLEAGATYYYRFRAAGLHSPIGRTRTLPSGPLASLGIALASCSNHAFGLFNAYDAIARDSGVDFVLHTGDYIYEYGADGWGGDISRQIGRVHEPAHEIVSLADYRTRHAQYKRDAGSRAMHAAHPFIACWDDHESANNPWTSGAQNHQPDTEGNWAARRAASIRAYYEWMPVREPEWLETKGRSRMQFWRSYAFGDLATLTTLETRHTARAKQIEYGDHADKIQSAADAAHLRDIVMGEPGRRLLAPELEADLNKALRQSVAAGQPWRLIGNPMPIARMIVPDLVGMGILPDPESHPGLPEEARHLAWKGKWAMPFYPDTWDGYPWARERLYDLSRKAGAGDLIFLTGDSHSFWVNELFDGAGRPAGLELGTAGISSPGDFLGSGFEPQLARALDQAFTEHVPEVAWTENMHNGYVRLDLRRDCAEATFVGVDTVVAPDYRAYNIRRFGIAQKDGVLALMNGG